MKALGLVLRPIMRRLTLCPVIGGIAGAFVGMVFGLVQLGHSSEDLSAIGLLAVAMIAGGSAWGIILVVVGLWLHYGARAIAFPALVTVLITAVLTVYANHALQLPAVAGLVGVAIALVVGFLLCLLCGHSRYLQWMLGLVEEGRRDA
jgi:hypothetical protein